MKNAEAVTFGGSGLDRAAELRGRADPAEGQVIALWRGKPLVEGPTLDRLVRVPLHHPVLAEASAPPILLGREETGTLVFARDLDLWSPEVMDASQLGGFVDNTEQSHPSLTDTQVFAELRRIMTRLSPRDAELAVTGKAILGWHRSHRFCAQCGAESTMAQSGWQRVCPECRAHHFPRTDPVAIMLVTRGDRVLLGRSPGWPEGMYSLLAGFVEPGETLEAAVRREVLEETGVVIGEVGYLASQPWAFPSSLMFGCWGAALSDDITIDPLEIEDAIWISRTDLTRAFAGEHDLVKPARAGAIAHFLLRHWLADTL